jgi:hypothetical protein
VFLVDAGAAAVLIALIVAVTGLILSRRTRRAATNRDLDRDNLAMRYLINDLDRAADLRLVVDSLDIFANDVHDTIARHRARDDHQEGIAP